MVIKGGARGGPRQLANHLLRTDHNETVTILHMEGIDAPNLHLALREMHAIGKGAQTKRTLYHANIDPRADERMTGEQNHIAVERLAERLGLTDQAYVVVEHVKNGRHHLHVVWSRIDLKTMTAVHDGHNFRKHEEVADSLAREFGHERIQGAHHRREGATRPGRAPTFADYQQAARTGMTPQQLQAIVTECWRQTRTGSEFRQWLKTAGFTLARGDRRDFVLIDQAGAVHSLARKIKGVNAAEVRQRMKNLRDELPDVKKVKEQQEQDASRQKLQPANSPEFESAVERLRKEEKKTRAVELGGTNQQIADAIYQLKKTLPHQMEQTISTVGTREQEQVRQAIRDAAAKIEKAAQPRQTERVVEPQRSTEPERSKTPVPNPVKQRPVANMVDAIRSAEDEKLFAKNRKEMRAGFAHSPQAIEALDNAASRMAGRKERWPQQEQARAPQTQPKRESLTELVARKKAEKTAAQRDNAEMKLRDHLRPPKQPSFERKRGFE